MDDLMLIVGALIVAVGVGLMFLPLGVVVLGAFVVAGGYFKAKAAAAKRPDA